MAETTETTSAKVFSSFTNILAFTVSLICLAYLFLAAQTPNRMTV